MHGLLTTPYDATDACLSQGRTSVRTAGKKTTFAQSISQFLEKCVDYECLRYLGLGDDCANVRDGWPSFDVTTSIMDVQTAVSLLDALSPVNV